MRVLVGDWQSAGTVAGPALTGLSGSGVTGLMGGAAAVAAGRGNRDISTRAVAGAAVHRLHVLDGQ